MPTFDEMMEAARRDRRPMVQAGGDPLAPFTPEEMAQFSADQMQALSGPVNVNVPPQVVPVQAPTWQADIGEAQIVQPDRTPHPNVDQLAPFTPEEMAQFSPEQMAKYAPRAGRARPAVPQETPDQIVSWAKDQIAPFSPTAAAAAARPAAPPAPRPPTPGATPATPPTAAPNPVAAAPAAPAAPASAPAPAATTPAARLAAARAAGARPAPGARPAAGPAPEIDAGAKPPSWLSTLLRTLPNAVGNVAGAYGKGGGSRAMGELIQSRNAQNADTLAGARAQADNYANKVAALKRKRAESDALTQRTARKDTMEEEDRAYARARDARADAITAEDRDPASPKNVTFRNAFKTAHPEFAASLPPGEFDKLTLGDVKALQGMVPKPPEETPAQKDARALTLYGEKLKLKEKALRGRVGSGVPTGGNRAEMESAALTSLAEQYGGAEKIPAARKLQVKMAARGKDPAGALRQVMGESVRDTDVKEPSAAKSALTLKTRQAQEQAVATIAALDKQEQTLLRLKANGAKYMPGMEPVIKDAGTYLGRLTARAFGDEGEKDPTKRKGSTGFTSDEAEARSASRLAARANYYNVTRNASNLQAEMEDADETMTNDGTIDGALRMVREARDGLKKSVATGAIRGENGEIVLFDGTTPVQGGGANAGADTDGGADTVEITNKKTGEKRRVSREEAKAMGAL